MRLKDKPLYIGSAGWSYDDWQGIVYPASSGRIDQLQYLSQYFNCLEVNVSFYRPVARRMSASWVKRVAQPDQFRFTFKLNQRFTHQRFTTYDQEEVDQFKAGLRPVVEAGMFGALLAQFPWSFRFADDAIEYLEHIRTDFAEFPIALEIRHDSWEHPEALDRLTELGLSLCTIDQPRLRSCIGPIETLTGPLLYVRLHGRNADKWFADNIEPFERYNYMYNADQLSQWSRRIAGMADSADEIFVVANNHYKGQAPANALQLRSMLTGESVDVPDPMFEHFPDLAKVATNKPPPRQQTLF